jgi:hypothetical protein
MPHTELTPILPDLDTDIKLVSLRATIGRLDALVEARIVETPELCGHITALATALRREVRMLEARTK